MNHFVEDFVKTSIGLVPRVSTSLGFLDHLGTIRARVGIVRNQYKINPGLYCVGNPTATSAVLVTANYKLSFDHLRKELADFDGWILVVDTRNINVWCAAGKNTFSTEEVALQVEKTKLAEIVSHRELILPQLAAPGVAAHELKKKCGFKGLFGPIRAADIQQFFKNDKKIDEAMRAVSFSMVERMTLIPVELFLIWKITLFVVIAIFLISGIGPDIFSLQASVQRGFIAIGATVLGIMTGAILVPLFLPLIPGRQFWLKGVLMGVITGFFYLSIIVNHSSGIEMTSVFLWLTAVGSYLAMNFTGATPYTSLSGVEYEMRRGLPFQIGGALSAILLWGVAPFLK